MLDSADSLLISLVGIFIPAILVSVFSFIYSWKLLTRHKRAISRLYKMSFSGIDNERKRIANLLHDHTGSHSVLLDEQIESLKTGASKKQQDELLILQRDLKLFIHESSTFVEHLYPKELLRNNWIKSFEHLALQMSSGSSLVTFENNANRTPSTDLLHHAFWAVQEKITNILRHSKCKSIQLTITEEDHHFVICILYEATPVAKKWLRRAKKTGLGRGSYIIADRLNIIKAKNSITIEDGYIIDLIRINYEDSNS